MTSLPLSSAGARFRAALAAESPLQVIGAINANHALLAQRAGYQAIYLSGGGVAAGSLGLPDLGINTLEDVLIDVRRITDVCELPLLVDVDTGFGPSAFNIERTIKSLIKAGAAGCHIEDQVGAKRCGHRPGKEIVSQGEMVDRVKAAADAKTDPAFFLIARTDAIQMEGVDAAIERAISCVEAGADGIFAEAAYDLETYQRFVDAVRVPVLANITEFARRRCSPATNSHRLAWRSSCSRCLPSALPTRPPKRCTPQFAAMGIRTPCWKACRRAKSCTSASATTITNSGWMPCSHARAHDRAAQHVAGAIPLVISRHAISEEVIA